MLPGTAQYELVQKATVAVAGYTEECGTDDPDYEFVCGFATGAPDSLWSKMDTALTSYPVVKAWERNESGDLFKKRVKVEGGVVSINLSNVLGDTQLSFMYIPD